MLLRAAIAVAAVAMLVRGALLLLENRIVLDSRGAVRLGLPGNVSMPLLLVFDALPVINSVSYSRHQGATSTYLCQQYEFSDFKG